MPRPYCFFTTGLGFVVVGLAAGLVCVPPAFEAGFVLLGLGLVVFTGVLFVLVLVLAGFAAGLVVVFAFVFGVLTVGLTLVFVLASGVLTVGLGVGGSGLLVFTDGVGLFLIGWGVTTAGLLLLLMPDDFDLDTLLPLAKNEYRTHIL